MSHSGDSCQKPWKLVLPFVPSLVPPFFPPFIPLFVPPLTLHLANMAASTWTLPDLDGVPSAILQAKQNIQPLLYYIGKAFGAAIQRPLPLQTDTDAESHSSFIQELARDAGGCQFLGFAAAFIIKYGLETSISELHQILKNTAAEEIPITETAIKDFMQILYEEMRGPQIDSSNNFLVKTKITCKTEIHFEVPLGSSRMIGNGTLEAIECELKG